jgi:hypothetical protein
MPVSQTVAPRGEAAPGRVLSLGWSALPMASGRVGQNPGPGGDHRLRSTCWQTAHGPKCQFCDDQSPPKPGAEHAAKAPEPVTGGHDCPMFRFSTSTALAFMATSMPPIRPPSANSTRAAGPDGWCKGENQQARCRHGGQNPNHLLGAVSRNRHTDDGHGAERADAEAQNHQPQFAFIQSEAGREFGDFWRPAADQEAIGEENQTRQPCVPGVRNGAGRCNRGMKT